MDKSLPEFVNNQRRRSLYRFTILALLSFQLPIAVAYLSIYFDIATYSYIDINYAYLAFIITNMSALTIIRIKKQITKTFINLMLYLQVFVTLIIATYVVYVIAEQRQYVPVGMLAILIFIFIQSTLRVSLIALLFCVLLYLSTAYIGINYGGQPGYFVGEILYIMVFVPVCIFIAYMSRIMQDQQKKLKKASSNLKITHAELEAQNEKTMESIRYAELIQRSLLPGIERIKAVSPDNMFIWMPKDIVGGDIFYTYADPEISIIALMDCTGHGVPGAFLTMIVYSEIRKIIMDEVCRDPSEILKRLNRSVKKVLHTNGDKAANDGLDAAVCIIDHSEKKVTYAGSRIPLFYVENGNLHKVNGDKQSIGYKDSSDDFDFTNHIIEVEDRCIFYMNTDGYTDQLGGEKRRRFGTVKFKKLILKHYKIPYTEQRKEFLQALMAYKGENEQIDDITLISFHL